MMKKTIITLLCCIGVAGVQAQKPNANNRFYHPYDAVELPAGAPAWMAELANVDTINYYEMEKRFRKFQQENPSMRTKTPLNKPILNYFYRWQRAYAPFVRPDGRIVLPTQKEYVEMVNEANTNLPKPATRAGLPTTEPWKVLSPMITYNSETKEVRPWQTNIQRFDVSPSNPDIIYAGTETGLIFKSTDKGQHWNVCTSHHFFGGEITSVEVSRTNPDKVVVSGGPLVWVTEDGGSTWKDITPGEFRNTFKRVRDVVINHKDDNTFIMANDEGVYKTTDNGEHWTLVEAGRGFDLKYKLNDPTTVYALIQKINGVTFCKSTDGGDSFAAVDMGYDQPLASGRIGLSSAPNGYDYVYVFACTADEIRSYTSPFFLGTPVLFKSTDAGQKWTVNTTVREQFEPHDRYGGQGYYDLVVQPSSTDPEKLLFGLLNLYCSTDGGNTVQNVGGYYGRFDLHCDMQDIKVVGDETWLSTDGGVIYSKDFFDKHAEPRINGIYASEFWGFDMGWNEDIMVGGRNHNGNMVHTDFYNGAAISVGGSEVSTGYVLLSNSRKVAFSDYGSCQLPDNWKDTFLPFQGFQKYPFESSLYGIGLEFDPRYAKSFYINHRDDPQVLWKTVDDGQSFVQVHTFNERVSGYAVSRANPDVILVGTMAHIYRSTNGGQDFTELSDLPSELINVVNYKIAIHPANDQEIWISTHELGGIFRTMDGGKTWEKMDQGLELSTTKEKQIISRLVITGNEKDAVYAVSGVMRPKDETYQVWRNRILYRDNTTNGWVDYSDGLPNVSTIVRMLPFYKEGKLRIATNNGIWERSLVDPYFKPMAQPIVLSSGTGENQGEEEWQFDSYSIVNQNGAKWEWKFTPEPLSISDKYARNPKVRIAADQSYDVTLTVETPQGKDSKTVKKMIKGKKEVPSSISGQEVLSKDIDFERIVVAPGEPFRLFPRGLSKELELTLYDAGGKTVRKISLQTNAWQTISTSGLPTGAYFYICKSAEFKKAGRLIIR